jgi:hypothetical protein
MAGGAETPNIAVVPAIAQLLTVPERGAKLLDILRKKPALPARQSG